MPPFFRKKRRADGGPNKNEKKVLRAQKASRAGADLAPLGQKYPHVQGISIDMEFITPEQQLMEAASRAVTPEDPCDFTASCPGRCGQGTFDFSAKIGAVVSSRHPTAEANGTCAEQLYPGSPDRCGVRLHCRITVSYLPEEE